MIRSKEYKAFKESLRQSLNNCQYENLGMPFDKEAQYALRANEYGTMTEFMDKLEDMIINVVDKAALSEYVKLVYEEITRYGVLFKMLSADYEQGTKNSRMTYDLYYLTMIYTNAIKETVNEIRNVAAKCLKIDLAPFEGLTIDSYNIRGKFIPEPSPESDALIPQPKIESYTEAEKKERVRLILAPLSGLNPQKQNIMSKENFNRLIDYTDCLVLKNSVPAEVTHTIKAEISVDHIRFTFYRLHDELFGTRRIRQNFIDFLHAIFENFGGYSPSTTRAKFNTPPKSYEKDFGGYIGEAS